MRPAPSSQPSPFRTHLDSRRVGYGVAVYRSGSVIYRQADACDSVLQVQSGRVRLSVLARSGKEGVVGLVGPGGFLGDEVLAGAPERRETATAITAVEVVVVAKGQMLDLLHTDQVTSDQFLAHVLSRCDALESSLTDQLLLSSEQRVARCLLELAECRCRPDGTGVLPPVSQTVIAEMAGTTRSHVNAFMAKFRRLGWLQRQDRELLVTSSLLAALDADSVDDAW